jgi:hypothetical protein
MNPKMNNIKNRFQTVLTTSSLLVLTLFLFGPMQIYLGNSSDVPYSYESIIIELLLISFFAIILFSATLLLIPERYFNKFIIFTFLVSLLFWLEGNFFVINYGLITGQDIPWGDYLGVQIIDFLVWVIILIGGYIFRDKIIPHISFLASILIIGQIIMAGFLYIDNPVMNNPVTTTKISMDENLLTFSEKKNVILIIVDQFQSDIFNEILKDQPSNKAIFDGFTYYSDAISGFPKTKAAIPHLISDTWYDNSIPYSEYIENEFANNSIVNKLQKDGYLVSVSPGLEKWINSNGTINKSIISHQQESGSVELIRVVPFRYFPHVIKQFFVYTPFIGLSKGHMDLELHQFILNGLTTTSDDEISIKIFYLFAAHPPFAYDENLNIGGKPDQISQSKGALKIIANLLDEMKRNNVYDNSAIIVTADHGNQPPPIVSNYNTRAVLNNARSLILVKDYNASGEMETSYKSVNVGQIPYTIAQFVNYTYSDNDFQNSLITGERKERRFLFHRWSGDTVPRYLPVMNEYIVSGPSDNPESWIRTGKEFYPPVNDDDSYKLSLIEYGKYLNNTYILGQEINCTNSGNLNSYAENGWSLQEPGFTWTDGHQADLNLTIPTIEDNVVLHFNALAFTVKDYVDQKVRISINNKNLDELTIMGKQFQDISIPIPSDYLVNGTNIISFYLPDAKSPKEFGRTDPRKLGIAVRSISLTTSPQNS